jgi:tetratricopeptide (TPR) repeat protein
VTGLLTAALLLLGAVQAPDLPRIDAAEYPEEIREALGLALERARQQPSSADAVGALGMLLHAYEQLDPALACYERSSRLAPEAFQWAYLAGVVHGRLAQHDEALQALREALARSPDYFPAQLALARTLLELGETAEAEARFRQLAEAKPAAPQPRLGLGRAAADAGRLEAAAASYLEATRLFEAYGAAHYALALAYRDLERPDDARRHLALYQQHLMSAPPLEDPVMEGVRDIAAGGPRRMVAEGVRLAEAGDLEQAVREHERALELDPDLHQAHVNLISHCARLGRWSEAEKHYRAAVALAPGRGAPHYDWGVALLAQRRTEEAVAAFREALEDNPHHAEAHNNLGTLVLPDGHLEEAAQHFRAALESAPGYRLARFNLARVLGAQGRFDEAVSELRRTL